MPAHLAASVPPVEAEDATGAPIVVGFSTSAASAAALRWALHVSQERRSPLVVVHVTDQGATATEHLVGRVTDCVATEWPGADDAHQPRVTFLHRPGPLVQSLQATATGADLLVIGRPGRCRHEHLEQQLRDVVECPVLAVTPGTTPRTAVPAP